MNLQTRKRRRMIQRIRNTLRNAEEKEEEIDYKQLVAAVCLDGEVSIRTSKEYIKVLIDTGKIVLYKGKLYFNDSKGGEANEN